MVFYNNVKNIIDDAYLLLCFAHQLPWFFARITDYRYYLYYMIDSILYNLAIWILPLSVEA